MLAIFRQTVDRSLDATTGFYCEPSAIAAATAAVSRSLVEDMARLEADNRRLSSTVHELRSRLVEIESERDELSSSIDRQKQENVRWSVRSSYCLNTSLYLILIVG
jgi:predicted RNase H-like nuclease (RuvC/YqgF family)